MSSRFCFTATSAKKSVFRRSVVFSAKKTQFHGFDTISIFTVRLCDMHVINCVVMFLKPKALISVDLRVYMYTCYIGGDSDLSRFPDCPSVRQDTFYVEIFCKSWTRCMMALA